MRNNFPFILIIFLLINISNKRKIDINFNVKDENNYPVKGAIILIRPYNSKDFINIRTCCHGEVCIKNISRDTYQVIIYKKGYILKTFLVDAYEDVNCSICLCYYKDNRLYGYIRNSNNKVIDEAIVVLYRVLGERLYIPIRFTYTDFTGEYNFFDVPKGRYIIKAIK